MNGRDFIAAVRKLGRRTGTPVSVNTSRGKGSHVTLWYGVRKTTVKDRKKEIGVGLLNAMCKQLGIDRREL